MQEANPQHCFHTAAGKTVISVVSHVEPQTACLLMQQRFQNSCLWCNKEAIRSFVLQRRVSNVMMLCIVFVVFLYLWRISCTWYRPTHLCA